ncbi:MAG: hypothetical protein R2939_10675 [Kofleriaceae bacterium]
MATPSPDSKMPAMIAFGLVAVGLVIAGLLGFTGGTIAGGLVAAAGAIPACLGIWKGIQQETQGTLAVSVLAVLVSLGVGGVLIVLRIIDLIRS